MDYEIKKDTIKKTLKLKKMTYADLMFKMQENGYEISEISLKKWLQEKSNIRPSIDSIVAMAKALGLRFDEITQINEQTNNAIFGGLLGVKKVPIVGFASCGSPIISDYNADEGIYLSAQTYTPNLYAIRACGDSMMPEISDGDIVVCNPNADILDGDLVHYTLFGESAIKVFIRSKTNILKLVPLNQSPHFTTLNITQDDTDMLDNFKMAKVVQIIKININNRQERLKILNFK
ncbi:S24 family peptidase [Campylobacter gastrosuis]|uniref:S24 family peptidase n=1 Tax=Campylobacter gastrosuis TaxID=2974576 RepID=A0ABT7HSZ6_9BACT|nr:S24 family peptidase [Campylobacter gastrosuis]MDL0090046.1 S24 family peptidase [Campylobacter gastrosuis]